MVLIVAMVMLVMLSMLGAYALNVSTVDMHIAGNYRNAQLAFYNCNEAEAFGPNNLAVLQTIIPNVVNSFPSNTTGFTPPVAMPAGAQGQILFRVEYICGSRITKGVAADQEGIDYHFLVTIVGRGANSTSECVVESEVIQRMSLKPQYLDYDC